MKQIKQFAKKDREYFLKEAEKLINGQTMDGLFKNLKKELDIF